MKATKLSPDVCLKDEAYTNAITNLPELRSRVQQVTTKITPTRYARVLLETVVVDRMNRRTVAQFTIA